MKNSRLISFLLLVLPLSQLHAISMLNEANGLGPLQEAKPEDCEKSVEDNGFDSFIDSINDIQNKVTCRSNLVEERKTPSDYCNCVRDSLDAPIDEKYIVQLSSDLMTTADFDQMSDTITSYLNLTESIDRIIKQSTTFAYTEVADRSLFCNETDLGRILQKQANNYKTSCSLEKLDGVFSNLKVVAGNYLGSVDEYKDLLQSLPENYSAFNKKIETDLATNVDHQTGINLALVEIMSNINGLEMPIDLKAWLALTNKFFANDPLFKNIRINLPDGSVVNPTGKYDITKHLKVDHLNNRDDLRWMSYGIIAEAIKKEKITLDNDAYVKKEACENIERTFEMLCSTMSDRNNYIAAKISGEPRVLLGPSQVQASDLGALVIPGAIQCHLAGMGKGFLSDSADAVLRKTLPFLFNLSPLEVGGFLRDEKDFSKLISTYAGTEKSLDKLLVESSEGNGLHDRLTRAAAKQKDEEEYVQELKRAVQRTSDGSFRLDPSGSYTSISKGRGHQLPSALPMITANSDGPTVSAQHATSPHQSDYSVRQVQGYQAPSLPSPVDTHATRYENDYVEKQRAMAHSPTAPTAPSTTFEDRLAKIFEQKTKSDSEAADAQVSASKRATDYRLQQSQEQINQLKKQLASMQDKTNKPDLSVASPAAMHQAAASRTPAFKGFEQSSGSTASSSGAASAAPSYSGNQASRAPSSIGASANSGSSGSSASNTPAPVTYEAATKSSGMASFKGASGGGNFTLSREDVGQGERVIIPVNSFNPDDKAYIKQLFEKTNGEPIFLSAKDENGEEKYIMLEANILADGSIEYVPTEKAAPEGKVARRTKTGRSVRAPASAEPEKSKKRTKVQDLKSLLGEQL